MIKLHKAKANLRQSMIDNNLSDIDNKMDEIHMIIYIGGSDELLGYVSDNYIDLMVRINNLTLPYMTEEMKDKFNNDLI